MDERSLGLVLRMRPLTETSLIVHWLTPNLGRLSTVAKGARRPKSPFRGQLDLFYLAEFSFQRSRRSDLHILREVGLQETHPTLRHDLGRLKQAAYAAMLLEQTTETETPLQSIFQLMLEFLGHLPRQPPSPLNLFAFELKLLQELGLGPGPQTAPLTPGSKQILSKLLHQPWSSLHPLKLSPAQTAELDKFLHEFLHLHLGRIPQGRQTAVHQPSA